MSFISNAYVEVVILSCLCGIVGVLACLRHRIFYTQALTHATFPGGILGTIFVSIFMNSFFHNTYISNANNISEDFFAFNIEVLNISFSFSRNNLLSLGIFLGASFMCLIMILFMNFISNIQGQGSYTAAGVLLTFNFALGFLLVKLFEPLPVKVNTFIYGSILTSSFFDICMAFICLVLSILVMIVFGRRIFFVCFDDLGFRTSGFNVKLIDFVILFLITCTVVVSLPAVGSVLSIALLVGPSAGAIKIVKSFWMAIFLGVILTVFAGCVGLWVSIFLGLSSSGVITVFCTVIYFVCVLYERFKGMYIFSKNKA